MAVLDRLNRPFRLALVVCLLLVCPVLAFGQTAASPVLWGRLEVPGTPAALAWAAGLDPQASSLTPEWVVLEAIRSLHGEPDSPYLRTFEGYLRLIGRYEADRRALGPALTLAASADRAGRERAEAFLRTAGLRLTSGSAAGSSGAPGAHLQVARRTDASSRDARALLLAAGAPIEDLEARLNAGEAIAPESLALPWFEAPLPMYEAWWNTIIPAEADRFSAIVSDRRTALLFYGLSSLDMETRRYLVDQPQLTTVLLANAATFAGFGGHLRVRGGRMDVPGRDEAVAWWEALAGAPVTAPDRFIARVLGTRSGRLAYFYALLDAIDPARVRFITGLSTPPATRPGDLFAWFDRDDPWFQPDRRPFSRPVNDPTLFVAEVLVDEEGRPAGPAWRSLWDAVFADLRLPADPARVLRPAPDRVDAAYWFQSIHGGGAADPRVRMNTVFFAQRVFADAPEESAADLLIALRGFQRFPMLALTLERMGVRSPAVYASAARMADGLSAIADSHQAFASLSQFQGALALIERAARTRRLDGQRAGALVASLALVPLDRQGSFGGDVARWIEEVLLPAVSPASPVSGPAPLERLLIAGLAGLPQAAGGLDARPGRPEFEWQGWRYHVDPSRALVARVTAIRQRQAGNTLDSVLTLSHAAAALSGDVTLEIVASQVEVLRQLRGDLREPQLPIAIAGPRHVEVATTLGRAADELQRITEPRRLNNAARVAARLHALTAALTADLLRAFAYAASIPDPQTSLLASGDVSHQHDLGVEVRVPFEREGVAWGFPERQQGGPWSVRARGSLLGLDIAMADLALGQGFLDRFELPPGWTFEDLRVYVQPLALFNAFDERLEEAAAVAAAIRAGRERVTGTSFDRAELERALADAGVSPLRRALVSRALDAAAPEAAERLLSASELVRLGGGADAANAAEAWGASTLVLDGCLCLAIEPPLEWELHAGRGGAWGFLGARSPDLLLRMAEALDTLGIPPAAAADLLVPAMQSMLQRSRLAHHDDRLSVVRDAVRTPAEIAAFVAAATTGGSVFPSSTGQ